jgi:serine phosphatase RsbU (regulator of sigma subunit)
LSPGEYFLAFSDGVTEAGAKGHGQQFQQGHLDSWLARLSPGLSPGEVVGRLVAALQRHVPLDWPEDDTTVVALRRNAPARRPLRWLSGARGWLVGWFAWLRGRPRGKAHE